MRKVPFILAGVVAMTTAYAEAAPPTPQFAIQAPDSPRAPQAIAVFSCRVDDLTGKPGRFGVDENGVYHPELAARNWRDLELHIEGGEIECKRQLVEIQDKDELVNNAVQLHHNFGDPGQCVTGANLMFTTTEWDKHHGLWAVVGIGCPTPMVDQTGKIVGWHIPECQSHLPGHKEIAMKCKFDESVI